MSRRGHYLDEEQNVPERHVVVRLRCRPKGKIDPNKDLQVRTETAPRVEDVGKNQVLMHRLYLSLDPAMRGWMRDLRSYVPPIKIGAIMRGSTINEVLYSRSSKYSRGDLVLDSSLDGGWSELGIVDERFLTKIDQSSSLSPSLHLGVLGGTGLTAFFGLTKIGRPKAGETVLVSGAAGATGSIVCQIAKIKGCKVVGIAGGAKKCRWLREVLNVDHAIDYKSANKDPKRFQTLLKDALKSVGSKGFDVFFDNVGGMILDEALRRLARYGRVVVCGAISSYNAKDVRNVRGISNYQALISLRARMEGFIVFDFAKEYPEARRQIEKWMREGRLVQKEDVRDGLYTAPHALLDLFEGGNKGKLVVRVGDRMTRPAQNGDDQSRSRL